MKIYRKLGIVFIVLCMITGLFVRLTVKAEPMFEAYLEYSPQGWSVKGVLKDFADDIVLVQPMCSTDGETYRDCGVEWNLQWLGSEDESNLAALQNQRCLYFSDEPLKSYIAKELKRFYIKLRIVREGGITYETQAAIIERGELQTVQEEFDVSAKFAPCVFVKEGRPPKLQHYGRYQITVSEDATTEEISALLPDTLPVQIQIEKGMEYLGDDIVECPVKWKPLYLPQLTAGERVKVLDAAEEIVVPAGIVLSTPTGIYKTNKPLNLNRFASTDEVRLILNVVGKADQPNGVLSETNDGLEMAFQLKPTGATSIRAYTLAKGESEWTEITGISLLDAVDTQPSTANSDFGLVLGMEQEPYLSYRKARDAKEEPTPFFVGFKIEGGVYDGRQLVLAWPETYELPPHLPEIKGSGGNEGNAGSDDKNDSTEGGQRPGLSQKSEDVSTSELSKQSEGELPEAKNPRKKDFPVMKAEIEEHEVLENNSSEIPMQFSRKQKSAASTQYEAAVRSVTEADVETEMKMEDESSNRAPETLAASREEMSTLNYEEENVPTVLPIRIDNDTSAKGSKMLFLVIAGVAILLFVGTIILQRVAGAKVMDALHNFFIRK